MKSWAEFELAAPEFAEAGRRLFGGSDGQPIGFLATVSSPGRPHLSPVCPIYSGSNLYLSSPARTPKVSDLRHSPEFVLHAFLAPNDEEFQLAGHAYEVTDEDERSGVHTDIPFASFDTQDPIFRLMIARALWVYWERAGQADTRPVRQRWHE